MHIKSNTALALIIKGFLFYFKDAVMSPTDDYSMPHWINLSFYSKNLKVGYSNFKSRINIPRKTEEIIRQNRQRAQVSVIKHEDHVSNRYLSKSSARLGLSKSRLGPNSSRYPQEPNVMKAFKLKDSWKRKFLFVLIIALIFFKPWKILAIFFNLSHEFLIKLFLW